MPSQNQVHCWSSSDKLSSGVIFDSLTNCYYGVFNYTRIGKWSQTSSMMKDMKKFNVSFFVVFHRYIMELCHLICFYNKIIWCKLEV